MNWGQRIPGIEPFDPLLTHGQNVHYSVIVLGHPKSLEITQAQAFSGHDDEVEAWGASLRTQSPRRPMATPSLLRAVNKQQLGLSSSCSLPLPPSSLPTQQSRMQEGDPWSWDSFPIPQSTMQEGGPWSASHIFEYGDSYFPPPVNVTAGSNHSPALAFPDFKALGGNYEDD